MYLIPHVLVGATIASQVSNPPAAILLSFLSHFALDAIPHSTISVSNLNGKRFAYTILLGDMFGAGLLALFLSLRGGLGSPQFWLIGLSCLAAVLPDAVRFPYYFLNYRPAIARFWEKWHQIIDQEVRHKKLFHGNILMGYLTQIAIIAICIITFFFI